jgi:hypothetical protein
MGSIVATARGTIIGPSSSSDPPALIAALAILAW